MNTVAKLFIDRQEWELLNTDITYYRNTWENGKPCTEPMGGMVTLSFEPRGDEDDILSWAIADRMDDDSVEYPNCLYVLKKAEIVFYEGDYNGIILFKYRLEDCTCVYFSETFSNLWGMTTTIKLSAAIQYYKNSDTFYIKQWRENWKPLEEYKTPVHEIKDEKPKLLVTKVKGEKEALINEEITYSVTGFNRFATEADKKRISWVVQVDKAKEVQKSKGEKLKLKIKKEWAGKQITVMPYLEKPTEKVSVKTKIIKWFLPRVLIQTKTYEGFGLKTERNIFEYQDAEGNGLTRHKPTDPIAEDMHYGSIGFHTNNFKLSDIKDKGVRENIKELNRYPTDDLFKLFTNLIEWTSKGALQVNNIKMVNKMRFGGGIYQDPILTNAVFNHESTKKFVEAITEDFKVKVKNNEGNLNNIKSGKPNRLLRPSFSTTKDRMEGLTIALNDTWGFRVTITQYSYNPQTREVEATLKFRIIDHFGLDVADVESYGTRQKVYEKFGKMFMDKMNVSWDIEKAKKLFEFIRTTNKYSSMKGFILDRLESSRYNPVEQMALGFCAWFVLQHLRGCKPFITLMEKEQTLKFKI